MKKGVITLTSYLVGIQFKTCLNNMKELQIFRKLRRRTCCFRPTILLIILTNRPNGSISEQNSIMANCEIIFLIFSIVCNSVINWRSCCFTFYCIICVLLCDKESFKLIIILQIKALTYLFNFPNWNMMTMFVRHSYVFISSIILYTLLTKLFLLEHKVFSNSTDNY